jgi:signal transduction histidine kinase
MKRFRWRVGGLYWRMTISYFLVTLLAALTIEFAVTLGSFIRDLQQPVTPTDQILNQQEARATSQAVPYLEQASPDQAALQRWLLGSFLDAMSTAGNGEPAFAAVLGRQGQPLVAASCDSSKSVSPQELKGGTGHCTAITATQANTLLSPTYTQAAINAALVGARRPVEIRGIAKQTIIAAPILSKSGQVLGALVAAVFVGTDTPTIQQAASMQNFGELLTAFLSNLQPAGFYFVLLATVIGTLSGVLISGGITRRLRRITQATAAWSQGEFQIAIADRSGDEVGQLAHDLNRMAEQLQTLLASRQELAVLEERNRLARELHDSVKQHVFANALLVRAARKLVNRDPERAQAHLAEAEQLADQAQQELIALIRALRPAAIADKGLAAALRDYAGDWQRRMGIAVEVRVQGERTTPLESEETLFRVAQEALTNIARHSDAQQVEICLAWSAEQVCLTIQDNGKGFDPARVAGKGVGLTSMRERVERLGGTFIVSSSGAGTTLEAAIPLAVGRSEPVEVVCE